MVIDDKVQRWLSERQAGHTLPRGLYVDPAMHEFDIQAIYHRHWIQAALESQLPRVGDYLTLTVGNAPIVVLRNPEGGLNGFFNTCRHRGAPVCPEPRGHARRLVCPYHQWTYDLNGQLLKAGRMPEGFDVTPYRLRPLQVETVAGLIFVCLSDHPPDFAPFRAALAPLLEAHDLRHAKVAHTATLIERADWKLVMENARECYHCTVGHPELMRALSDFTAPDVSGRTQAWLAAFDTRCESKGLKTGSVVGPWYEIGRYPLADGVKSYTLDGTPAVTKTMGRVGDGDVGALWWAVQPNGFNHVVGDYAFFFRALPTRPQETTVTGTWIVHEDAVEGVDYDVERLIELWDATNLQDRALAENNQLGVNSIAYAPGPYSGTSEQLLRRFTDWYCATAQSFLAQQDAVK